MKGKTVLITGATNGIGLETAKALAKMGAHIVMVGRSAEKTRRVVDEVRAATDGSVDYLLADLSLMSEVRRLADEYRAKYDRLDVLLNNAGAIYSSRQVTSEGLELTFALNHISYFLLTNLLLDLLKKSAPSRIINVSSDAHQVGGLNLDDLNSEKSFGVGGFNVYGRSKLMNIVFTYELARRLEGTGVTANALHPGLVATGFNMNNAGWFTPLFKFFVRFIARTPENGAETSIYLASSPEVEGVTGKYFADKKPKKSIAESYNETTQRRLWELSEQITGLAVKA